MRYLVIAVLAATLAGCSGGTTASPTSSSTTPTTTTTTTSAPPKLTAAEAEQKVGQAMVTEAAFAPLGGKLQKSETPKVHIITATCGGMLPSGDSITHETSATWNVSGNVVKTKVVHYDGFNAKNILEGLRKLISCGTYVETWTEKKETVTVAGEITLPKPAEADGQASWCESLPNAFSRCFTVLTRGTFAAVVQTASGSKADAEALLGKVAPVAATALANVG